VARNAVRGALTGRTVVELPEPVDGHWTAGPTTCVEAVPPNADNRTVVIQERSWWTGCSAADARALAVALLAAADAADRLAAESSEGGEP
jgi:hypothetical protein